VKNGVFRPRVERVQALFRFAHGPSIQRMHVQAVGASVDLRGPHLDQVEQLVLQAAPGQILFQVEQRLHRLLSEFPVVDTRLHGDTSLKPSYMRTRRTP
jgi:hypothetical protein